MTYTIRLTQCSDVDGIGGHKATRAIKNYLSAIKALGHGLSLPIIEALYQELPGWLFDNRRWYVELILHAIWVLRLTLVTMNRFDLLCLGERKAPLRHDCRLETLY